ncbi:MAG: dual specificity protein phosphatase family protein [Anaerolineales bacterium]|nr:dual specificity protein phosphatase family protein [Anaerolineales bacterium]
MDRIRPWLYIGKYRDTLNPNFLAATRIEAMLQLAELVEHPGIVSLYLPIEDFQPIPPDLLRQGVDFVRAEKQRDQRVLIACGAGINRSTAFAVAALREEEGLGLLDAFRAVKRVHPEAMPHPPIWASLCEYYQEDFPFEKLIALRTERR